MDLLSERASQATEWLALSAALWGDAGVHPDIGFHEELSLEGVPVANNTSRVRVQARQTFSFALLASLADKIEGLDAGALEGLASRGVDAILDHCQRPDGLFGRRMAYAGGLADDTADLYDNAFVLLALTQAGRLGNARARAAATALSDAVDAHFRRPSAQDGFFEVLPDADIRLQNPHMHLLEASLFHAVETGHAPSAARAHEIETLMSQRFLSREGGLREIFRPDWQAAEGDRYETGHQFEWVWLLHQRAKTLGGALNPATTLLYNTATRLTGGAGEIYLEHHVSGSLKDSTQRCWGVTEAIKAHIARLEAGDGQADRKVVAAVDHLFGTFLDPSPVRGGWIDRFDGTGHPLSQSMPASTGYHIYLALAELLRITAKD